MDKNYVSKEAYLGEFVYSPERIRTYDFDFILIAINNDEVADEIKNEIEKEFGITSEKIIIDKILHINEFYA